MSGYEMTWNPAMWAIENTFRCDLHARVYNLGKINEDGEEK